MNSTALKQIYTPTLFTMTNNTNKTPEKYKFIDLFAGIGGTRNYIPDKF